MVFQAVIPKMSTDPKIKIYSTYFYKPLFNIFKHKKDWLLK